MKFLYGITCLCICAASVYFIAMDMDDRHQAEVLEGNARTFRFETRCEETLAADRATDMNYRECKAWKASGRVPVWAQ